MDGEALQNISYLALFLSGLRLSIPLLFAALGGFVSEKSGVANIALEGFLLVGAFSAASVSAVSGPQLGLIVALAAGALVGLLFASLTVLARGDHIVMGTAVNLLVMGTLPLLSKLWFGFSGSTPSLSLDKRLSEWGFFIAALLLGGLLAFGVRRSVFGLRLRAAGENMEATRSLGISVIRTRMMAVVLSGVIAAAGGAYLSIAHGSQFTRGMSSGRGFIALAALILAGWRPLPTILACLLFGFADASQIVLQSFVLPSGKTLPVQFIQMFPYFITLMVLIIFVGRTRAPRAIGKNTE